MSCCGFITEALFLAPDSPKQRRETPAWPPLQALLLLWFIVEDHDTLFILSESVHFLGIGVLAYKLLTKKNCSGVEMGAPAVIAAGDGV